jgi:hypothetical protein
MYYTFYSFCVIYFTQFFKYYPCHALYFTPFSAVRFTTLLKFRTLPSICFTVLCLGCCIRSETIAQKPVTKMNTHILVRSSDVGTDTCVYPITYSNLSSYTKMKWTNKLSNLCPKAIMFWPTSETIEHENKNLNKQFHWNISINYTEFLSKNSREKTKTSWQTWV